MWNNVWVVQKDVELKTSALRDHFVTTSVVLNQWFTEEGFLPGNNSVFWSQFVILFIF